MNNFSKLNVLLRLVLLSVVFLIGCKKKDDPQPQTPQLTGATKQYALVSISNTAISGTVTFSKRDDNATVITVQLSGTTAGAGHPAHIHANTAAEGGAILLDLTNVDGTSGRSETIVSKLNNGSNITYEQLLTINGYVNVHLSSSNLATIIAQGDVGKNELTSTNKTYQLNAASNPSISGTAKFTKRVSGETLVSIDLVGTSSGGNHPAHIHMNTVIQGGSAVVDLTNVNGATGKSVTSVNRLNNGTAITYDELLNFNGYINVHESGTNLTTIIAEGNIGANENVIYNVTNSGASGYIFNGGGLTNSNDPTLTLKRGRTYVFNVNASGHPFFIKTAQVTGSANAYNDGVTNNGAAVGTITFTVPTNAPNTLFYICSIHSSMTGTINVID